MSRSTGTRFLRQVSWKLPSTQEPTWEAWRLACGTNIGTDYCESLPVFETTKSSKGNKVQATASTRRTFCVSSTGDPHHLSSSSSYKSPMVWWDKVECWRTCLRQR